MNIHITATPRFEVPLSVDHIITLILLSGHHYDWKCKAAGQDTAGSRTRPEGFLLQMLGEAKTIRAAKADGIDCDDTVNASLHELDLCLKIMEVASLAHRSKLITDEQMALCQEMRRDFIGATDLANQQFSAQRATYVPVGKRS